MHTGRLLPSLLAVEPLKPHFQLQPGNEISYHVRLIADNKTSL